MAERSVEQAIGSGSQYVLDWFHLNTSTGEIKLCPFSKQVKFSMKKKAKRVHHLVEVVKLIIQHEVKMTLDRQPTEIFFICNGETNLEFAFITGLK